VGSRRRRLHGGEIADDHRLDASGVWRPGDEERGADGHVVERRHSLAVQVCLRRHLDYDDELITDTTDRRLIPRQSTARVSGRVELEALLHEHEPRAVSPRQGSKDGDACVLPRSGGVGVVRGFGRIVGARREIDSPSQSQ
jgi:hypothetical protein